MRIFEPEYFLWFSNIPPASSVHDEICECVRVRTGVTNGSIDEVLIAINEWNAIVT